MRASVPTLLLFFALVGRTLPAVLGPAVGADATLEAGEGELCSTVPTGQKLITLTFNNDPRRSTAARPLDGLSERGVGATFFLVGAQIENNGGVVRRMDEEGHQIDIHTFDHIELTDLSRTDFGAQMETTRALLKSTLDHNDLLLRPPYDVLDESVEAWAGCSTILWSIDPEDWRDQNADRVVREVVVRARDGGIILTHGIFPGSVDAALQIVDQPHQQGHLFCTVGELFTARGLPLEAGEMH